MKNVHADGMRWIEPKLSRIAAKEDAASSFSSEWMAEVDKLVRALGPTIQPSFDALARAVEKNSAVALRALGLDIRGQLGPQIDHFRDWNMRLMVNAGRDYASDVASVLDDPDTWGLRIEEIASLIQDRADVAESHAELIARDQSSKLNGSINSFRQQHAGVDSYEWSTSLDERVRETHAANEGKVFAWSSPPVETGAPTEDVQCRCVAIPVIPELDEDS